MAVQPQTPYKEYTANGSTNSFALDFYCDNQDHLIVLVDDIEPVVGTWSLSGGAVVFGTAPTTGKQIAIQRNTPFRRDEDFQSYDNSFRPPGVNKGFDKIWLKLQELGVADWILSNRIDALKAYVDDRDDELRAYLLEEIRKQGVALEQLDDYYNYLMQRLAQIAVDKGWDASFVVDGDKTQKQINDEQSQFKSEQIAVNDAKADKYGFRWSDGTAGQESAINTIIGYADNAIASNVRGAHVQQGSKNNENIIGGDASTVGVDVPNVVDTSKTYNAHYAVINGYDNVNNVLAGLVYGFHCKALDDGSGSGGATHAAIFGGSYHTFIDGDYSAAVGGTKNTLDYKAGGAYSFFGAGINGVIKAKFSTIISSFNSRIGGTNGIELTNSGIYHSNISTIDGNYATVLGGNECKATKDYSFARGKGAVANSVGESVFSTGKFKTAGDSGQSTLHLLRQTTNQIETQLLCSDDASGNTITPLGVKTSILVKALITAYNVTTNSTAAFEIVAHMSRDSENVVLNSHTVTPIFNPETLAVAIVPSTTLYQVRVTGLAGNTINWTCKLEQVWSRNI